MKKKAVCPHCGAAMVEHKHSLSKGLVEGLRKLHLRGGPVNIKHLQLTRNQWDNFYKLRYWGLAEKHFDAEGNREAGVWKVTQKGHGFMEGSVSVAKTVWSYRGEFRRFDGREVFVGDIDEGYRERPDYARDARPVFGSNAKKKSTYKQVEFL